VFMRTPYHRSLSVLFLLSAFPLFATSCASLPEPGESLPGETGIASPVETPAHQTESTWLKEATSRIELGSYHVIPAETGLLASNSRQSFDVQFGSATQLQGDGWAFSMTVAGIGSEDMLVSPGMGQAGIGDCLESGEKDAMGACLKQVVTTYGTDELLIEWWENRPEGLHQGFTVQAPVAAGEELVVALAISGTDSTGSKLELTLEGRDEAHLLGAGVDLQYAGLQAWDATGRALSSYMSLGEQGLELHIDTANAVWPVDIDPTITNLESNQASADFGYSIAGAGDVNGDGYDDVIVGSPLYDNGQTNEGRAFVYMGSSTGISTTASWTAESNQAQAKFGWSVAGAGDVNGDGYDDVIVGAPYYDNGQTDEGRAYVYHGSSTGLATSAAWTSESNQASAYHGYAVGSAGDTNNDGYDEVIVGATYYDNGQTNEGRAVQYAGSSTGLGTSTSWSVEFNQIEARGGWSVGSAGDVNGDGYSDVFVGVVLYDNGQTNEGRVYVYNGSSTGSATSVSTTLEPNQANAYFGASASGAGDVNGDGYDDLIVGAYLYDNGQTNEGRAYIYHGASGGLSTTVSRTLESNQTNAYFGYSVAGTGDLNGDGYDDVVIGAYLYDNGATDEGMVSAYYGSSTGIGTSASWTGEGDQATAYYGFAVAGIGDVNGDGFADLGVGSPKYDNGSTDEGIAAIVQTTPPDADGDGDPDPTDCNDADATIYTGATEVCDGVDQDCDGVIDDNAIDATTWYADSDSDTYGDPAVSQAACSAPLGYVADNTDCDDTTSAAYPGATESCDGIDNDCDSLVDEAGATGEVDWYLDSDSDGYGDDAVSVFQCDAPAGYVADNTDCDDADGSVNPGAAEADDLADQDCDGWIDEDFVAVGDIIITEINRQPRIGTATIVTAAQWFEVYNTSSRTVDLSNWFVARTSGIGTDRFYIDPADVVQVAPGGYLTLCETNDYENDAGVAQPLFCDYQWKDESQTNTYVGTYKDNTFHLQRDEDNLQLYIEGDQSTGTLIDNVHWYYDAINGYWPRDARFSLSLDPAHFTGTDNDVLANWCSTTAVAGVVVNTPSLRWYDVAATANDEHGTPTATNYDCP
jgi:hypothetical protein